MKEILYLKVFLYRSLDMVFNNKNFLYGDFRCGNKFYVESVESISEGKGLL
jgi:hypothetical protein